MFHFLHRLPKYHFRYYLKNLILLTPWTYGYYLHLKQFKDGNYDYQRDKYSFWEKHHGENGWKNSKEGAFRYRDYGSYEEYVTHQAQKFDVIIKLYGGIPNKDIRGYRIRFYQRFCHLGKFLPVSAKILCLGARQGTEVEVLRDLGFKDAIGIDLNPGPDNPFVRKGDFMALDYPDNSLDMVYSNCVDHAFDLDKFFREHARVLKPGGLALYDIADQEVGGGGPFEAVEWSTVRELLMMPFKHYRRLLKFEAEGVWSWFLLQK